MVRSIAVILLFIFIGTEVHAQQNTLPEKISLVASEQTFEEVINRLVEKYNLSFYFSSSKIPVQTKITIHAEALPLTAFLDEICRQAGINYRIRSSQVVFLPGNTNIAGEVYNLSGFVADSATGERMIGATIVIPALKKGTTTNAFGYYSYSLPPGTYQVQYSFIGYLPVVKQLVLSRDQVLSVNLSAAPLEITEVRLESSRLNRLNNLHPGTDVVPAKIMNTCPALMGEKDLMQFLKMMPGVQTNIDGLNGLYVRGTLPQHSSFIVDDAPMFNMYHFSGWFATINPDAVKEIRLYKGHLPARTGGSLGSIVDIRLKDGNNQHFNATGGIGTLTSRLTLEGPIVKDKASFIVSGRRTYFDQLLRLVDNSEDARELGRFYFYDMNGKVNYTLNHNNRFYVSAYSGRDKFWEAGGTKWGNSLASARWNHLFSEKVFANMTITGSWYDHSFRGYNYNDNEDVHLLFRLRNYNLKYDLTCFTRANLRINAGIGTKYNLLPPVNAQGGSIILPGEPAGKKTYKQLIGSAYAESSFSLSPKLKVDAGLRLIVADKIYPNDMKTRIDPEPSVSVQYAISEETSVKAAGSRNYQYYHGVSVFELIIPFDKYLLSGAKLKPQYADHLSAGFFYSQKDNRFEFSIDSYYSLLHNQYRIPISEDIYYYRETEMNPIKGRLKTYGLEVSFRKLTGKLNGMVSYTWSNSKIRENDFFNGRFYHPYYDRRHNFVLSVNYSLKPRIMVSSNWVYMSGNPYSYPTGKYELRGRTVPLYDSDKLYNQRMPAYHRLDISCRFNLDRRKPSQHSLSISVFNVYSRKNALFYTYNDIADGDTDKDPNSGYQKRYFDMMEFHFFNIFPSLSYEFKFGK
ncbi:MAG: TonB-dependent receptor [Bacteroidales bacterium]|nr:TonB-dependent receptor [Bacteroidales bacterium]